VSSLDVTVHPPFTDLRTVQSLIDGERLPLGLGAQHCYYEDRGAFTGEVSPQMLARLGVAYVLVGHSERRQIFDMTDEAVALTLRAVLRHEMTRSSASARPRSCETPARPARTWKPRFGPH